MAQEQKPERIRTLGCGGLIRLAMELDKNDYQHEPKVVLDTTDGTKDAKNHEAHVRVSLAESACRKLGTMLLDFANKMAAARGANQPEEKCDITAEEVVVETPKAEKDATAAK
ncbi:MAG: hypothetical protein LUC43_05255 [Burkholderiales bacterium]|nr:hypothetical protein [Burkholderiales bacterium]